MGKGEYILTINPGSTSTKVAIFKGESCEKQKALIHSMDVIKTFEKVIEQLEFRMAAVLDWLKEENVPLDSLAAVVGRGGILRPMPGGTYIVTEMMLDDLKSGEREEHASNLGAMIAKGIGDRQGIPSFIVDPVAVDEFDDLARISGLSDLPRTSLVHALNIKAISRRVAKMHNLDINNMNIVVAHLGGGISICPVKAGKLVDASGGIQGGPFSADRTGGIPVGDLIRMAYSEDCTYKQFRKKVIGEGGLVGYLGTNDLREVEKRIDQGDKNAELVFEAMCYQISKEIIAMVAVLCGKADMIVLTGGMAYSKRLVNLVTERVKFAAPVEVIPGEDEMLALCQGALRVLGGEEKAKIYEKEVSLK